MNRMRLGFLVAAACRIVLWDHFDSVRGQSATIEQPPALTIGDPGSVGSSLGAMPGDVSGNLLGSAPGSGSAVLSQGAGSDRPLSGGMGLSGSRAPSSITDPNQELTPNAAPLSIAPPRPASSFEVPSYGAYSIPDGPDDEGPANGLTLDLAIEILLRDNLDLRGKSYEIPQAQADILSAGLRSNPVFYADGQLVPYGAYSKQRPGGQTQYDVNISYPFDLSGKRIARTLYATRAKRVVEAQYQNAARLSIDQLYGAFVNVLAARQTVLYARSAVTGMKQLLEVSKVILENKSKSYRSDVNRVLVQLNAAQIGLADSEELLNKAKRDLAELLNIPADQAESIEVRGSLQDLAANPGTLPDLVNLAISIRPDVIAYRLGAKAAEANVALQKANRLPDVYLMYQPYTFQSNAPLGLKSPTSWALGMTVPLPIYNRNQGGIAKAKLNVTQSLIELDAVQRMVMTQVQQVFHEYTVTQRSLERIRKELEPAARAVRDDIKELYIEGEVDVVVLFGAQRDYQIVVKQFLDTAVRHRRAMLALNTAVGQRLLP